VTLPTPPPVPRPTDRSVSARAEGLVGEFARQRRFAAIRRSGAVAAIAAVGLVAMLTPLLGEGTTPNAFAGWTAVPKVADQAQSRAAHARCARVEPAVARPTPVIAEQRGQFTLLLFVGGGQTVVCISDRHMLVVGVAQSVAARSAPRAVTEGAGGFEHLRASPVTFLTGRAGAGVSTAVLDLADGRRVTASISHGWYVAWWPRWVAARRVSLGTKRGAVNQRLHLRTPLRRG